MDPQDLFFSLTEGWSKWHLWLGSKCLRPGTCLTARWHWATWHCSRVHDWYTPTCACAYSFDVLMLLLPWEWFLAWRACMFECEFLSECPCVARQLSCGTFCQFLTSDLIPLCVSSLKCHPINSSHLFMYAFARKATLGNYSDFKKKIILMVHWLVIGRMVPVSFSLCTLNACSYTM